MSKEAEVKYDFEPWDGTPGDSYDKYEKRLLNHGSRTDDRGWSLSDQGLFVLSCAGHLFVAAS